MLNGFCKFQFVVDNLYQLQFTSILLVHGCLFMVKGINNLKLPDTHINQVSYYKENDSYYHTYKTKRNTNCFRLVQLFSSYLDNDSLGRPFSVLYLFYHSGDNIHGSCPSCLSLGSSN